MTSPRQPIIPMLVLATALSGGCASDGGYSGSSSVSVGTSFYYGSAWYGNPAYWYGSPGYVVVAPPGGAVGPPNGPVAPGGDRPTVNPLPAQQPSAADRSRMPSAQPRMSTPSARTSMPRGSRGGGRRR